MLPEKSRLGNSSSSFFSDFEISSFLRHQHYVKGTRRLLSFFSFSSPLSTLRFEFVVLLTSSVPVFQRRLSFCCNLAALRGERFLVYFREQLTMREYSAYHDRHSEVILGDEKKLRARGEVTTPMAPREFQDSTRIIAASKALSL